MSGGIERSGVGASSSSFVSSPSQLRGRHDKRRTGSIESVAQATFSRRKLMSLFEEELCGFPAAAQASPEHSVRAEEPCEYAAAAQASPEHSACAEEPRAYAAAAEESPPGSPVGRKLRVATMDYQAYPLEDALESVVKSSNASDYLRGIAAIYNTSSLQLTLANGTSIQIQLKNTGRHGVHSNFYKIVGADRLGVPISSHISNQLLCAKVIRREHFRTKSNLRIPESVWLPNSETQYNYLKQEDFSVISMDFGYWRNSAVLFVEEAIPIDRPLWGAQDSVATLLAAPHSALSKIVEFFLFGYRSSCKVPLDLSLANLGYTQAGRNLVLLDCMEHTDHAFSGIASNCLSTFINGNNEVKKYMITQLQAQGFHRF